MKIISIIGARPQFIKASVVSKEFRKYEKKVKEILIHTGQHFNREMNEIFFEEMDIPSPQYNLGINSQSNAVMIGKMLIGLEKILKKEKPKIVIVYGDTNSTLAGALAAKTLSIPVAHIEAGLRSNNTKMPEEINRILTDRISKWLFCPTDNSIKNLKKEGFPHKLFQNEFQEIYNVGDVMYDSILFFKNFAKKPNAIKIKNDFILCTIHRAENTDNLERLINIFQALEKIGKETPIILPLHPRTRKIMQNSKFKIKNLIIINPVGYLEMLWLLQNCKLVITDSGGLQKESFFMKKYCIVLREETEWTELVENGYNHLAGVDEENIINLYNFLINKSFPKNPKKFYGDGKATKKIVDILIKNLS